jgi:hypothetical protein
MYIPELIRICMQELVEHMVMQFLNGSMLLTKKLMFLLHSRFATVTIVIKYKLSLIQIGIVLVLHTI